MGRSRRGAGRAGTVTPLKDRKPGKAPAPVQLQIGAPAKWREKRVPVGAITVSRFGSPPEDELVRSVGVHGVLLPVLLEENGAGTYKVIDGRQRVVAALMHEHDAVPARVRVGGDSALLDPAITLAGNVRGHGNPIVELEAVEEIIRQGGPRTTAALIARETGVPLKKVKAAMALSNIDGRLRDGWLEGRFGTKVGLKAAACDKAQQGRLARTLEANGKLTMDDVDEVRRTAVRSHQRTLAGDRKLPRAIEALEKVRRDLFLDLGKEHPAIRAVDAALEALREEAG